MRTGPKKPSRYTVEYVDKLAVSLIKWFHDDPERFWLKNFALENDMSPARLHELAKSNEKFSLALERAHAIQEGRIVEGAMTGKWNVGMSIFTLKNVAGWRDQRDVKMSGDVSIDYGHRKAKPRGVDE